MPALPPFDATLLERICRVVADTGTGLSGSEIGDLLSRTGIPDPWPGGTKWRRLHQALSEQQRRDKYGNCIVKFLNEAMAPVRYIGRRDLFETKLAELNPILAFCGYAMGDDGKVRTATTAKTLNEAETRAGALRAELLRRQVHADVLASCRAELVQNNCFHAVLEASKSVAQKIRDRTGLAGDGAPLVDQAFGTANNTMPFLAFNTLQTGTERMEHNGLMNLMKGMFGAFRNPTAHASKTAWTVSEQDAIDLMSIASLLHRKLDAAARTPRTL